MATSGFEYRQPARDSFAFSPAQPVASQPSLSGQSRGAALRGQGGPTSGVVNAGPQTDVAPGTSAIPAFFEQAMEPLIKRRQAEAFNRGVIARMSGMAQEEIEASEGKLGRIFGPSGFVAGARAYSADKAVADAFNELHDDLPNLRRLPEDDLNKAMTAKLGSLLTGNAPIDAVINQSFLEKLGPFTNTVVKARREWQEQGGIRAQAANTQSQAAFLENTVRQQADLTPDKRDGIAVTAAENSFLASMQKPEGMTDDAYRGSLYDRAMLMLASDRPQLHAFNALKGKGFLTPGYILDNDQITRLNAAELSANNRANRGIADDPWIIDQIAALHADTADNRITAPLDAAKRLRAINDYATARTGSDLPLYDAGAVVSAVNAVTDAQLGARRKFEARQQAIADRDAAWAHSEAIKKRDQDEAVAQVRSAFNTGDVAYSLAKGLGRAEDYDSYAASSWAKGDMTSLARAFNGVRGRGGGWVSGQVASMAQSMVSAFGPKYTPAFDEAHQRWKAIDAASPGAAARYFGKFNLPMKAFDSLVSQNVPAVVAYERSFGTPGGLDLSSVEPTKRKALREAVDGAVDDLSRSNTNPLTWGKWKLAQSSADVVKSVIGNEAATYLAHTGMSPEAVVGQTATAAKSSGHYEIAGRLAWRNDTDMKPLSRVLGAQDGEFSDTFMEMADKRLKDAGFTQGAYAEDYSIHRFGNDAVYILGLSPDGSQQQGVLITVPELRAELDKRAKRALSHDTRVMIRIDSKSNKARMQSYRDVFKRK